MSELILECDACGQRNRITEAPGDGQYVRCGKCHERIEAPECPNCEGAGEVGGDDEDDEDAMVECSECQGDGVCWPDHLPMAVRS